MVELIRAEPLKYAVIDYKIVVNEKKKEKKNARMYTSMNLVDCAIVNICSTCFHVHEQGYNWSLKARCGVIRDMKMDGISHLLLSSHSTVP
jgi:hypothetical protein